MSKHLNILDSTPWRLEAAIEGGDGAGIHVVVDREAQEDSFVGSCEPWLRFTAPPVIEAIKARFADDDLIEDGNPLTVPCGWEWGEAISLWFANLVAEECQGAAAEGDEFIDDLTPWCAVFEVPVSTQCAERVLDDIRGAVRLIEDGNPLTVPCGWEWGEAISLWFANLVAEECQGAAAEGDEFIDDLTPWCAEFEVPVSTQCAERLLDDIRVAVRLIERFATSRGDVPRYLHPAMFTLPEACGCSLLNKWGSAPLVSTADVLGVALGAAREAGIDEVCVFENTHEVYDREAWLDD